MEKKDTSPPEEEDKPKEGVIVERKRNQNIYNASNFTTGQAAASLTSTALAPTTRNDKALFDEVRKQLAGLIYQG
jgi:peptidyl-prolyl cis-trans isomerase-like protein 2